MLLRTPTRFWSIAASWAKRQHGPFPVCRLSPMVPGLRVGESFLIDEVASAVTQKGVVL